MPSPPITLYMTTIASQPVLRQRQEYIFRILQAKKIPFNTYDLASDEEAKRLWRRKAPIDKQQLPGILVGGKYPGTFGDFEDAVEHDELDIFLRLKEKWDPSIDEDRPPPEVKPVGIPGAASPLQMTPDHLKPKLYPKTQSPSPLRGKTIPVNKRIGELDMGDELSGFGLQGVKVTEDELRDLIADLGLDGDEAGDLAAGLTDMTTPVQGLKLSDKASSVQGLGKKKKEEAAKAVERTTNEVSSSKDAEPTRKAAKASKGEPSGKDEVAKETAASQEDTSKATVPKVEDKLDSTAAKP